MKKLFLDDVRKVSDIYSNTEEFHVVKNYKEFVEHIETFGLPSFISFDHDLADEHYDIGIENYLEDKEIDYSEFKEYTGMECAKWLVEYCIDNKKTLPDFFVHSANPAGKDNIQGLLDNFKKHQNESEK